MKKVKIEKQLTKIGMYKYFQLVFDDGYFYFCWSRRKKCKLLLFIYIMNHELRHTIATGIFDFFDNKYLDMLNKPIKIS